MSRQILTSTLLVLPIAFVTLEACSTFESSDTSADAGVGGDGSIGKEDAPTTGDASTACPPLQPFCDGGVELSCPGLEGRCLFFCPSALSHDNAQANCAAWGGCLLGVQDAPRLNCVRMASQTVPSSGVVVDLVQDAAAKAQREGWGPSCPGAPQPTSIMWGPNEPDDGNDAGAENHVQQCAFFTPAGILADNACGTKFVYVCDRPR